MRPARAAEADIGRKLVPWLEASGWDVYQEVDAHGGRADVVAVKGKLLAICELKQGPSLDLVDQILRWKGYAHLIFAATWPSKSQGFDSLAQRLEFGWLVVPRITFDGAEPHWKRSPRFERARLADLLAQRLNPGQKTHAAAGSKSGGAWAPWRDTARELQRVAKEHPGGILLKAAIDATKHHYRDNAAGRRGAQFLIEKKLVPGVKIEKRDGRLMLLPEGR